MCPQLHSLLWCDLSVFRKEAQCCQIKHADNHLALFIIFMALFFSSFCYLLLCGFWRISSLCWWLIYYLFCILSNFLDMLFLISPQRLFLIHRRGSLFFVMNINRYIRCSFIRLSSVFHCKHYSARFPTGSCFGKAQFSGRKTAAEGLKWSAKTVLWFQVTADVV